jgi:CspA family cold shock protein
MPQGRIKWYSEKKGYGFIETDEDADIFFHASKIADHGHFGLQKQDPVSFDIKSTPRGVQAVNVKPV